MAIIHPPPPHDRPVSITITEVQQGSGNGSIENYLVRALQKNENGKNNHLELVVELDEDKSELT